MKVTRYFQSCLLVEEGNARLLIDPSGQEAERIDEFGKLDAVLYTHEDGDHFDADLTKQLADAGAAIYANASTAKKCKSPPTLIEAGQEYKIAGVNIKAVDMPHCLMWDGSAGSQNTGLLIARKLFHSGDSTADPKIKAEVVAAPIGGPDISWKDAIDLAKFASAKIIIPIHYDYLGAKPEVFAGAAERAGFEARALELGQSTEI